MNYFTKEDENCMQLALELAAKAACVGEVPVGAVLLRNSEILGQGYNQPISKHDASAHAEIAALREAGKAVQNYRLPNSTLYVTLEPCTMCLGMLIHARVSRLVYAAKEPRAGALGGAFNLLDIMSYNHKMQVESGLFADQSAKMLKEFFGARRK